MKSSRSAGRPPELVTVAELVSRARQLAAGPERRILGITGAPGAGKSTVAAALIEALAPAAVLAPMDGFHLHDDELRRLGSHQRKGAPDTFDAIGYVNLLRRLHCRSEPITYAPIFDRNLEMSIGSAQPVPREAPLVITEGNYLLLAEPPWGEIADLLDECWYLDPGEQTRLGWLVDRHVSFGRSPEDARIRAGQGSDAANAARTAAFRDRADWIIRLH